MNPCPRRPRACFRTRHTTLASGLVRCFESVKIDGDEPPGLGLKIRSKIEGRTVRTGEHEFSKRLVDDLDRLPELAALSEMIG